MCVLLLIGTFCRSPVGPAIGTRRGMASTIESRYHCSNRPGGTVMARLTRRRLLQACTAGVTASAVVGMPLATSAQPATPKRGGTVTVALVQAPPSLDAQLTS